MSNAIMLCLVRIGVFSGLLCALGLPMAQASPARHALVIGIDNYQHVTSLQKARNDAKDVAERMKNLGYRVTLDLDSPYKRFNAKFEEMLKHVARGDDVFVYFAGHGVELEGGKIMLLPADVPKVSPNPASELTLESESIALDRLMRGIQRAGARLTVVIVDACRDNPFPRAGTRSVGVSSRGVGRPAEIPNNVFMIFSAGTQQTALDRLSDADPNRNSVFTRVLLPLMNESNLSLLSMAKRLQRDVEKLAASKDSGPHVQTPAYYDQFNDSDSWGLAGIARRGGVESGTVVIPAPADPAVSSRTPGTRFRDCPECPEMVVIPAGSFLMGSSAADQRRAQSEGLPQELTNAEGPQHDVRIGESFALASTEVTVGQFEAFVTATGYRTEAERDAGNGCRILSNGKWDWTGGRSWRDPGFEQGRDHPVVCVSWNDAKEYVRWLSSRTGKGYRLPSEAEWEYAARGGTTGARYWGEDATQACRYANVADRRARREVPGADGWVIHDCDDGASYTAAVGGYAANAFGLHDVLGNALEWVEDCWNEGYAGAPTSGGAWVQGDCDRRVLRGGAWNIGPAVVRAAFRYGNTTTLRFDSSGLRPARMLP